MAKLPMFPIVESVMPAIYAFDVSVLKRYPQWFLLNYNGPNNPLTIQHRADVWKASGGSYGFGDARGSIG